MKTTIKKFLEYSADKPNYLLNLSELALSITNAQVKELNALNEKEQKLIIAIYGLWEYVSDYLVVDKKELKNMPEIDFIEHHKSILYFNITNTETRLFRELLIDYGLYYWEEESDKKVNFKFK